MNQAAPLRRSGLAATRLKTYRNFTAVDLEWRNETAFNVVRVEAYDSVLQL